MVIAGIIIILVGGAGVAIWIVLGTRPPSREYLSREFKVDTDGSYIGDFEADRLAQPLNDDQTRSETAPDRQPEIK